jgi:periplasmic copper chaperone A
MSGTISRRGCTASRQFCTAGHRFGTRSRPMATVAGLCLLLASGSTAAPAAGISIAHPVLRVAHAGAKTGAGYLAISNHGKVEDRLISVETQGANRSDLHGTVAVGTVMQMRLAAGGVPIPAGATVKFAPGGLHVMFIGLKMPLPPGTRLKARLIFARVGAVDVQFKAEIP